MQFNSINKRTTCKNRIRALCKEDGELTTDIVQIANLLNEKFFSAYSIISTSNDKPSLPSKTDKLFVSKTTLVFSEEAVENAFIHMYSLNAALG